MRRITVGVAVAAAACMAFFSTPARSQAEKTIVIRNARIFDGRTVTDHDTVIIRGERIVQVGRELDPEVADAEIIDAAGGFLMPGMIDAHTHTFDTSMLRSCLVFGVTTTLDMFTSAEAIRLMRSSAGPEQADIFSAGHLVTAPGGHGTQFGLRIPVITEAGEAEAFVAARLEEGSDFIKIVYDGGRAIGRPYPTIDLETLKAVINATLAHDRLAVVHIHDYQSALETIQAGASGLVHTVFDKWPDDRLAEAAAERGSFVIPTLAVIESVCGRGGGAGLIDDADLAPYLDSATARSLRQNFGGAIGSYDAAQMSVKRLHDAGVPILAGTDAPNPGTAHGVSMHRELELLVEAGLDPIDALRAATSAPATCFRLKDRGRIIPGMLADLVLVEGDPTVDITSTRRIVRVWKRGRQVDRESVRTAVEDAAHRAVADDRGASVSLVSDFEGDEPSAEFGAGWMISTDSMMGGSSTAQMRIVEGGADGSAGALEISGSISEDSAIRWAGAMFSPGEQMFAPRNLSAKDELIFHARGAANTYRIMVFDEALGRVPAEVSFTVGPEWKEFRFPIAQFGGIDGSGLMAVLFTGGPEAGDFTFVIDDVRFD